MSDLYARLAGGQAQAGWPHSRVIGFRGGASLCRGKLCLNQSFLYAPLRLSRHGANFSARRDKRAKQCKQTLKYNRRKHHVSA